MRVVLSVLVLSLVASEPSSASYRMECHFEADLVATPEETRDHPDEHPDGSWLILDVSVVEPQSPPQGLRYCKPSAGPRKRSFAPGARHRIKVPDEPTARAMSRGSRARFHYEYGDFVTMDRGPVAYEAWKFVEILGRSSPPPNKALQRTGE